MRVEKRRYPRTPIAAPAQLRWTGPNRTPVECDGQVHDYSRSGMRIETALPVAPDVLLTVTVNDRVFRGVVRYCASIEDRFVVGLEF